MSTRRASIVSVFHADPACLRQRRAKAADVLALLPQKEQSASQSLQLQSTMKR